MKILNNEDYLKDLQSDLSSRTIAQKWGIKSKSTVNSHRKKLGIQKSLPKDHVGLASLSQSPDGELTITKIGHEAYITLATGDEWVREAGKNPEDYDITVSTNAYGDGLWSNRIHAKPKLRKPVEDISHDKLIEIAERVTVDKTPKFVDGKVESKIMFSDYQLGKVGSRGGTPETLARGEYARNKAYEWLNQQNASSVTLFDGGDQIENFESGGNPMRTNDLSLPRQIEEYTYELTRWVKMFQPDALVTVPSNHSAWRYGKQVLGLPSDDYGITISRTVATATGTPLVVPEEHQESVAHHNIGLAHGNQFNSGKGIDWWKGQAFGNNPVAFVDVLATGHYHTGFLQMAGINPLTGNQRYWIGIPTMDNGSDWYRNKVGVESKPGFVCFNTVDGVFDVSSVKFFEIPF